MSNIFEDKDDLENVYSFIVAFESVSFPDLLSTLQVDNVLFPLWIVWCTHSRSIWSFKNCQASDLHLKVSLIHFCIEKQMYKESMACWPVEGMGSASGHKLTGLVNSEVGDAWGGIRG